MGTQALEPVTSGHDHVMVDGVARLGLSPEDEANVRRLRGQAMALPEPPAKAELRAKERALSQVERELSDRKAALEAREAELAEREAKLEADMNTLTAP